MAQHIRFTRDFDFWVSPAVVIAHKAGQEKYLPNAQVEAALKAKAAEVINDASRGKDERSKRASPEASASTRRGSEGNGGGD